MGKISPEQLASSGSEHGHQSAIFCWAAANLSIYPDLKWLFAIPNGGLRHPATANKLKAEGVKSGVPDIMLPKPKGKYAGFWMELKVGTNTPMKEQLVWFEYLNNVGYYATVCNGWKQAVEALQWYCEGAK